MAQARSIIEVHLKRQYSKNVGGLIFRQVKYRENSWLSSQIVSSQVTIIFILQLFDNVSSTYTYLLGDPQSRKCILIDPVLEHAKRDYQVTKDLNLNLVYAGKSFSL